MNTVFSMRLMSQTHRPRQRHSERRQNLDAKNGLSKTDNLKWPKGSKRPKLSMDSFLTRLDGRVKPGHNAMRSSILFTLLPRKLLIFEPVRDDAVDAEATFLVFLVGGEIAFEPFDMAVAFEGPSQQTNPPSQHYRFERHVFRKAGAEVHRQDYAERRDALAWEF